MRTLTLVSFMLALTSCVAIVPSEFYKPTYPKGNVTYEGGWCHGAAGPSSVIKLHVAEGVVVKVGLEKNRENTDVSMNLELDLTSNTTAQFETNQIYFVNPASLEKWTKEAIEFSVSQDRKGWPPTETISRDKILPTDPNFLSELDKAKPYKTFSERMLIGDADQYTLPKVSVTLPDIIADGHTYKIPAIQLQRYGTQLSEYIYKEESIYVADFLVSANLERFDRYPVDRKMRRYLKLEVTVPPTVSWRFKSNRVLISDLPGEDVRLLDFKKLYPISPVRHISFVAPIKNLPLVMQTRARANFKVNVRPFDTIIVQLPSMLINGKRIQLDPITFKKSTEIVGVPFNC